MLCVDRFMLQLAEKTDGVIVTNDQLRDIFAESQAWQNIIKDKCVHIELSINLSNMEYIHNLCFFSLGNFTECCNTPLLVTYSWYQMIPWGEMGHHWTSF